MLRPQDRMALSEAQPEEREKLVEALGRDSRLSIAPTDGYVALNAYVPPKERRGLVLVDPPYEEDADFSRLSNELAVAHSKWPSGIFLLWYPIKERAAPDALARRLRKQALPNVLRCELMLSPARADAGLAGSGLILLNPPFRLDAQLRALLPELGRILSPEAACRVEWLARES
jgi:23S rRNA (adenine2030-N6)-methyltransferase